MFKYFSKKFYDHKVRREKLKSSDEILWRIQNFHSCEKNYS